MGTVNSFTPPFSVADETAIPLTHRNASSLRTSAYLGRVTHDGTAPSGFQLRDGGDPETVVALTAVTVDASTIDLYVDRYTALPEGTYNLYEVDSGNSAHAIETVGYVVKEAEQLAYTKLHMYNNGNFNLTASNDTDNLVLGEFLGSTGAVSDSDTSRYLYVTSDLLVAASPGDVLSGTAGVESISATLVSLEDSFGATSAIVKLSDADATTVLDQGSFIASGVTYTVGHEIAVPGYGQPSGFRLIEKSGRYFQFQMQDNGTANFANINDEVELKFDGSTYKGTLRQQSITTGLVVVQMDDDSLDEGMLTTDMKLKKGDSPLEYDIADSGSSRYQVPLATEDLAAEEVPFLDYTVYYGARNKDVVMVELHTDGRNWLLTDVDYIMQYQGTSGRWTTVYNDETFAYDGEYHFSREMEVNRSLVLPAANEDYAATTNWWSYYEASTNGNTNYILDADNTGKVINMFQHEQDYEGDSTDDEPRPLHEFTVTGGVPITNETPFRVRVKEAASATTAEGNQGGDTLFVRRIGSVDLSDPTNVSATYRVYSRGHALTGNDPEKTCTVHIQDKGNHTSSFTISYRVTLVPSLTPSLASWNTNLLNLDNLAVTKTAADMQADANFSAEYDDTTAFIKYWPAASFINEYDIDGTTYGQRRHFQDVVYHGDYDTSNAISMTDDDVDIVITSDASALTVTNDQDVVENDDIQVEMESTTVRVRASNKTTSGIVPATIEPRFVGVVSGNAPVALEEPTHYATRIRYFSDSSAPYIERTVTRADDISDSDLYTVSVYFPLQFRILEDGDYASDRELLASNATDALAADMLYSSASAPYAYLTLQRIGGLQLSDPQLVKDSTPLDMVVADDNTLLPLLVDSDTAGRTSHVRTTIADFSKLIDEQDFDLTTFSADAISINVNANTITLRVRADSSGADSTSFNIEDGRKMRMVALARLKEVETDGLGVMLPYNTTLQEHDTYNAFAAADVPDAYSTVAALTNGPSDVPAALYSVPVANGTDGVGHKLTYELTDDSNDTSWSLPVQLATKSGSNEEELLRGTLEVAPVVNSTGAVLYGTASSAFVSDPSTYKAVHAFKMNDSEEGIIYVNEGSGGGGDYIAATSSNMSTWNLRSMDANTGIQISNDTATIVDIIGNGTTVAGAAAVVVKAGSNYYVKAIGESGTSGNYHGANTLYHSNSTQSVQVTATNHSNIDGWINLGTTYSYGTRVKGADGRFVALVPGGVLRSWGNDYVEDGGGLHADDYLNGLGSGIDDFVMSEGAVMAMKNGVIVVWAQNGTARIPGVASRNQAASYAAVGGNSITHILASPSTLYAIEDGGKVHHMYESGSPMSTQSIGTPSAFTSPKFEIVTSNGYDIIMAIGYTGSATALRRFYRPTVPGNTLAQFNVATMSGNVTSYGLTIGTKQGIIYPLANVDNDEAGGGLAMVFEVDDLDSQTNWTDTGSSSRAGTVTILGTNSLLYESQNSSDGGETYSSTYIIMRPENNRLSLGSSATAASSKGTNAYSSSASTGTIAATYTAASGFTASSYVDSIEAATSEDDGTRTTTLSFIVRPTLFIDALQGVDPTSVQWAWNTGPAKSNLSDDDFINKDDNGDDIAPLFLEYRRQMSSWNVVPKLVTGTDLAGGSTVTYVLATMPNGVNDGDAVSDQNDVSMGTIASADDDLDSDEVTVKVTLGSYSPDLSSVTQLKLNGSTYNVERLLVESTLMTIPRDSRNYADGALTTSTTHSYLPLYTNVLPAIKPADYTVSMFCDEIVGSSIPVEFTLPSLPSGTTLYLHAVQAGTRASVQITPGTQPQSIDFSSEFGNDWLHYPLNFMISDTAFNHVGFPTGASVTSETWYFGATFTVNAHVGSLLSAESDDTEINFANMMQDSCVINNYDGVDGSQGWRYNKGSSDNYDYVRGALVATITLNSPAPYEVGASVGYSDNFHDFSGRIVAKSENNITVRFYEDYSAGSLKLLADGGVTFAGRTMTGVSVETDYKSSHLRLFVAQGDLSDDNIGYGVAYNDGVNNPIFGHIVGKGSSGSNYWYLVQANKAYGNSVTVNDITGADSVRIVDNETMTSATVLDTTYVTFNHKVNWYLNWDQRGNDDPVSASSDGNKPDVILDGVPGKRAGGLTGLYALVRMTATQLSQLSNILLPVYTQPKGDGLDDDAGSSWYREIIQIGGTNINSLNSGDTETYKNVFLYFGDASDYDQVQMFGEDIVGADNYYTSALTVTSSSKLISGGTPTGFSDFHGADDTIMGIAFSTNSTSPVDFDITLLEMGWTYDSNVKRLRCVNNGETRELLGDYAPIGTVTAPFIPTQAQELLALPLHKKSVHQPDATSAISYVYPRDNMVVGANEASYSASVTWSSTAQAASTFDQADFLKWNESVGFVHDLYSAHQVEALTDAFDSDAKRQLLLGKLADMDLDVTSSYARGATEVKKFRSHYKKWAYPELFVARDYAGNNTDLTTGNFVRLNTLDTYTSGAGYIVMPLQFMEDMGEGEYRWRTSLRYIGGAPGWNTDITGGADESLDPLRSKVAVSSVPDGATVSIANIAANTTSSATIDFPLTVTIDASTFDFGVNHAITLTLPAATLDGAALWSERTFTMNLIVNNLQLEGDITAADEIAVNAVGTDPNDTVTPVEKLLLPDGSDNRAVDPNKFIEGSFTATKSANVDLSTILEDVNTTSLGSNSQVNVFLAHFTSIEDSSDGNHVGFYTSSSTGPGRDDLGTWRTALESYLQSLSASAPDLTYDEVKVVDADGVDAPGQTADGIRYFNKSDEAFVTNALLLGGSGASGTAAANNADMQTVALTKGSGKHLSVTRIPYVNGNPDEAANPYAYLNGERNFYLIAVDEVGSYFIRRIHLQSTSLVQRVELAVMSNPAYQFNPIAQHSTVDCTILQCTGIELDGSFVGWDNLALVDDVRNPHVDANDNVVYADDTAERFDVVIQRRLVQASDTQTGNSADLFHNDPYYNIRNGNNRYVSSENMDYKTSSLATVRLGVDNPVLMNITMAGSKGAWQKTQALTVNVSGTDYTGCYILQRLSNSNYIIQVPEACKDVIVALSDVTGGNVTVLNVSRNETTASNVAAATYDIAQSWTTVSMKKAQDASGNWSVVDNVIKNVNIKELNEGLAYYPLAERPATADHGYDESNSNYSSYFQYQILIRNRNASLAQDVEEYKVSETIADCYRSPAQWKALMAYTVGDNAAQASDYSAEDTYTNTPRNLYATTLVDERNLPPYVTQGVPEIGQTWSTDFSDTSKYIYNDGSRGIPVSEQDDDASDPTVQSVYYEPTVGLNPHVRVPRDFNKPASTLVPGTAQVTFLGNTGAEQQVSAVLTLAATAPSSWADGDLLDLTVRLNPADSSSEVTLPATLGAYTGSSNAWNVTLGQATRRYALEDSETNGASALSVANLDHPGVTRDGAISLAPSTTATQVRIVLADGFEQPTWSVGQTMMLTYDNSGTHYLGDILVANSQDFVVELTQTQYDEISDKYVLYARNYDAGTYTPQPLAENGLTSFETETVILSTAKPGWNVNDTIVLTTASDEEEGNASAETGIHATGYISAIADDDKTLTVVVLQADGESKSTNAQAVIVHRINGTHEFSTGFYFSSNVAAPNVFSAPSTDEYTLTVDNVSSVPSNWGAGDAIRFLIWDEFTNYFGFLTGKTINPLNVELTFVLSASYSSSEVDALFNSTMTDLQVNNMTDSENLFLTASDSIN